MTPWCPPPPTKSISAGPSLPNQSFRNQRGCPKASELGLQQVPGPLTRQQQGGHAVLLPLHRRLHQRRQPAAVVPVQVQRREVIQEVVDYRDVSFAEEKPR